uniref:FAD-binding domain-containing protein n=1 Tax=Mycena chlorophos TaxID=658473 RepID=A0ABQ0M1G4_MYCCL|nr:predicted protein [Mycena chlorophos]
MSTTLPQETKILIIGAGPVGMAAAIALRARGFGANDITIVDALLAGQNTSRAMVIQSGTLEALAAVDCVDKLLDIGTKVDQLQATSGGDSPSPFLIAKFSLLQDATKFPFSLSIPQMKTEQVMLEKLESIGIHVLRPFKAIGVESGQDGRCIVEFESGEVVRAKYVVGADGAHSMVRAHLGIDFKDPDGDETLDYGDVSQLVLGDIAFDTAPEFPSTLFLQTGNGNFVLLAPFPEKATPDPTRQVFRFASGVPVEDGTAPHAPSIEYIQSLLNRTGPSFLSSDPRRTPHPRHINKVYWSSRYRTRSAIAERCVVLVPSGGPVFLVGDAAHIHSPLGGQGMSLGIRDAVSLAPVIKSLENTDGVNEQLMKEWGADRHAKALAVIALTKRALAITSSGARRGLVSTLFELFQRAVAYRTTAKAIPSSQLLCAAINSYGDACNAPTKNDSRWCPRHDEKRVKLYVNYKAHHATLQAIPDLSLTVGMIKKCACLETVRGWNKLLMTKFCLLNRCINAREYFTARFFGNDMDFGHRTFWHFLQKQLQKTEALLGEVEQRACQLLLEDQNALWVLERQVDAEEEAEKCSGHDDRLLATASKPKQHDPTDITDVEDPLDVALREKGSLLWEKIKTRLARYCTSAPPRLYAERVNIIHACVRRAVCTDVKLLVAAQGYDSVHAMLADSDLDVAVLESLWNAIRRLDSHQVRASIDDVLRSDQGGDEFTILGGRVYKTLSGNPLPFRAWGHLIAVFLCYSCVRRVCKTIDEVITLTRYAILDRSPFFQSSLTYDNPAYPETKIFNLCGFMFANFSDSGERSIISKCNCAAGGPPHWSETAYSYLICGGLSLTDPKAAAFVEACFRACKKDPDLMVLARRGPEGKIRGSHDFIWAERKRQAHTRAGLRAAEWEPARTARYRDTVLQIACPEISGQPDLVDCYQLVIADGGSCSMGEFVKKISDILLRDVWRVKDDMGLMVEVVLPLVEKKEIELSDYTSLQTETDLLAVYKRLWGKDPAKLVDDEYRAKPTGKRKTKMYL